MQRVPGKRTIKPREQVQRRRRMGVAAQAVGGGKKATRRLSLSDERLLKQILAKDQDYIDSPVFYEEGAEAEIYGQGDDIQMPDTTWYHPVMDDLGGSSSRTRSVKSSQQVILTGAQERILFHQFNYARHRVRQLQIAIDANASKEPNPEQAEEILRWHRLAERIREQIAETNLALVLAMAKRTRMSEVDFADLVSEGNMALLRAVDKFDAGRGYKFSTYACRAILKAFSRQGMKLSKYRQRFPTDFDPKLEKSNHLETKRADFEADAADEVKRIVLDNRADLTDIERTVIEHRFNIKEDSVTGDPEKPMTLEQVGQIIGVTKERVRQIQNKAMEKIKVELESNFLGANEQEDEANREGEEAVAAR